MLEVLWVNYACTRSGGDHFNIADREWIIRTGLRTIWVVIASYAALKLDVYVEHKF